MTGNILPSISIPLNNVYLHNIEVEILRELNLNRLTQFDGFFQFISNSVSYVAWGLPILLLIIAFFLKDSQSLKKVIFVLSSVIVSSLISLILKYVIDRPRPFETYDFLEKISSGGSPSFPSGHTTEAFAIAVALIFAFPKWYNILPSILWAIAVAYSRMSLGVHYPSDVLGGIVVGILSVYLCLQCQNCFKSLRFNLK
jgi:undecaprenyl-diphosphatase